jgi:hypothetical protein
MSDGSAEQIAEYRRKAEECRRLAAKALGTDQYAGWVLMAKSWDELANAAEQDEAARRLI